MAVLPGLRHGSSSPDQSAGSPGSAPGPAPGGRCNVTPFPAGRPKASASAAGGGAVDSVPPGSARTHRPGERAGHPVRAAEGGRRLGSTAGRSNGRGASRGVVPFDSGAPGAAGRTQGSPSDSLITIQPASAAVKSA